MTRWSASALHLAISLLIGLAFVALTRWVWYPGPLFDVSGAVGLLTILIPADIVLGPLLTLLVFKSGKPSLKFDLTVIALVQTAALFYGAWTIAEARPAYVVFFGNQLKVVRSTDVAEQSPWSTPLAGPGWVGILAGGALDAELADLMAGLEGKKPLQFDEQQYLQWPKVEPAFIAALRTVDELKPSAVADAVAAELDAIGLKREAVRVMPVTVREQRMTAVFSVATNEFLAIVPVVLLAEL